MSDLDIMGHMDLFETEEHLLKILEEMKSGLLQILEGRDVPTAKNNLYKRIVTAKGASKSLGIGTLYRLMDKCDLFIRLLPEKIDPKNEKFQYFLREINAAVHILKGEPIDFQKTFDIDEFLKTQKSNFVGNLKNVVVIDDEPEIVNVVSDFLCAVGFEVEGFHEAIGALNRIAEGGISAVITDISMPGLSGFEILQQVNAIDPDIPVIYLTGNVTKELLVDSVAYGIYAVFEKPFDSKALVMSVTNATRRYELLKVLNKTINLIAFHFSNLDGLLKNQGRHELRLALKLDLVELLSQQRAAREIRKI